MSGHIVLIIGPSGAGKNTLINGCKGLIYIPSFTTRLMRPGESQGNPYHFVPKEEFLQRIAQDEFFEYQEVHDNLYGTSKRLFSQIVENNQIGITDIDIVGGLKIKQAWPERVLTIFIRPTNINTLTDRLKARNTDSAEVVQQRLKRIRFELGLANQCDVVIYNDVLETAREELNNNIRRRIQL